MLTGTLCCRDGIKEKWNNLTIKKMNIRKVAVLDIKMYHKVSLIKKSVAVVHKQTNQWKRTKGL